MHAQEKSEVILGSPPDILSLPAGDYAGIVEGMVQVCKLQGEEVPLPPPHASTTHMGASPPLAPLIPFTLPSHHPPLHSLTDFTHYSSAPHSPAIALSETPQMSADHSETTAILDSPKP